jgi:GT2 family glycosyltransferase
MTISQASVDVVILSWNRGDDTVEAIHSALGQVGVDVHVLVVDQGSDSTSLEKLRERQRRGEILLTELPQNPGPGPGRNIAMAMGSSPYIVGIDNDAVFEDENALRRVVDYFDEDPELGALAFRIKSYATRTDDPQRWPYPRPLKNRRDQPFWTTRYVGCGHAIRRATVEKTHGYDPCLIFNWEELDLAYQVIDAGYRIRYEPSIVVLHKLSPEARFWWEETRFYYLVRNAIYLDYKYYRKWPRLLPMALGYTVKGLRNRLLRTAVSAVKDGLMMCRHISPEFQPLTSEAKEYIDRFDRMPRGSIVRRIKDEIFENLPHQSRQSR